MGVLTNSKISSSRHVTLCAITYVSVINLKLYQISSEARNIRNETAMCTNVFMQVVGVEKALMDVIPILRDTLPNIRVKKKKQNGERIGISQLGPHPLKILFTNIPQTPRFNHIYAFLFFQIVC